MTKRGVLARKLGREYLRRTKWRRFGTDKTKQEWMSWIITKTRKLYGKAIR